MSSPLEVFINAGQERAARVDFQPGRRWPTTTTNTKKIHKNYISVLLGSSTFCVCSDILQKRKAAADC